MHATFHMCASAACALQEQLSGKKLATLSALLLLLLKLASNAEAAAAYTAAAGKGGHLSQPAAAKQVWLYLCLQAAALMLAISPLLSAAPQLLLCLLLLLWLEAISCSCSSMSCLSALLELCHSGSTTLKSCPLALSHPEPIITSWLSCYVCILSCHVMQANAAPELPKRPASAKRKQPSGQALPLPLPKKQAAAPAVPAHAPRVKSDTAEKMAIGREPVPRPVKAKQPVSSGGSKLQKATAVPVEQDAGQLRKPVKTAVNGVVSHQKEGPAKATGQPKAGKGNFKAAKPRQAAAAPAVTLDLEVGF